MSKLIIIRGVPGAGKSTKAKQIAESSSEQHIILEADMYWYKERGFYDFDFEHIARAHRWCLDTTKILLRNGHNVIVANTFTTMKEMNQYISFACELDIPIEVITLTTEFGSIHGVPDSVMDKMRNRIISNEVVLKAIEDMKNTFGCEQ